MDKHRYIVKGISGHWRLQNEADLLKRYQKSNRLQRPYFKLSRHYMRMGSSIQVCFSQEVETPNRDSLLSTVFVDVKLDNIFVNHGSDGRRFSNIQLGDCGEVVSIKSKFAKDGHSIGAGISRSPEAILEIGWGTPTDIWSFGNAVRSISNPPQPHLWVLERRWRACRQRLTVLP